MKLRIERFTGIMPIETDDGKSHVKDASGDILFGFPNVLGMLSEAADSTGRMEMFFDNAKNELENIMVEPGVTAINIFEDYRREFKIKEIKNRERLKKEYFGTRQWKYISTQLEAVDVDIMVVIRSIIRLYTTDHIYNDLNKTYRAGESIKYQGFGNLLMRSSHASPYFMGTKVYRGTTINDLENYKVGTVYRWPFFISASASKEKARSFGGVLFTIEIPEQFSISDISMHSIYPDEQEVLFHPYTRFQVLEKGKNNIHVTLYKGSDSFEWI